MIFKIDKDELDFYINLIPYAAQGKIIQTENKRADFGATVFNCFNQQGNLYEVVILSEMSDLMDKTNLNSYAVMIDTWLKDLHVQIFK